MEIIQAKVEGKQVVVPAEAEEKAAVDILDALRLTIASSQEEPVEMVKASSASRSKTTKKAAKKIATKKTAKKAKAA
jgi:bifunctional DNA-binding transcriptional regulator/antitoxin component of YhaV-PrlF toxin-antitoxin module|tara:strand:+ start:496 stop:726 length:231 start_codon:yes stop_codon:yes gene_type:complete